MTHWGICARAARAAGLVALTLASGSACRGLLQPPQNVVELGAIIDRPLTRIALGSCSKSTKPQPIWRAVNRDAPDLYLALGDNVYGDTEDMSELRAKYWRQEAEPGFAELRRRVPVYGTWDDHDYGQNDAGREYPKKAESQQIFLDFLRVPADSPRRARRGVYDAVVVGPPGRRVHLIALDLRYHRSLLLTDPSSRGYRPDTSPEATMLGEEQWAWLERELTRPTEVRILLSSTQFLPTSGSGEKWANMPLERERLLKALGRASPASNLVVSGDRHFSEISALDPGPTGAPLYELTSSGLTETVRPHEHNDLRVGGPYGGISYGLVDLEWAAPVPSLVLHLRDRRGRDVATARVPMSPPPPSSLPAAPSPPASSLPASSLPASAPPASSPPAPSLPAPSPPASAGGG